MKRLTEPERKKVANAWGRDVDVVLTDYEVEASDVGRTKENYTANGPKSHTFTKSDIGRTIREDSAWCGSWYFIT